MPEAPDRDRPGVSGLVGADGFEPPTSALAGTAGLWGAAYTIAITRYPTASGSARIWVAIAVGVLWAGSRRTTWWPW
ncbi:hypothetical protein ACIBJC_22970 [Streptomyces sp. NPDC050509]|uniref:hypothetical protein n=1 Tax=Streptomyces sp. NPDC050509 TaxID=3365620 RepID=UPI00379B4E20